MQAEEYYRLYQAEERMWWFRGLRMFLGRLLPSDSSQSLKALDIGCGTGGFLRYLSRRGFRAVGLDYSPVALQYAARRDAASLIRGSANDLPFRGTFDLVVCVNVLELENIDPQRLVDRALMALKPGGHGLFVMSAHQWLLSEHDRAVNSVRRYNLRQLKQLFDKPGIGLLRATYLFMSVFPLLALRKLLNPMQLADDSQPAQSDVSTPHPLINEPLAAISWFEAQLLSVVSFPMGSSALILVKKDG